jgi:Tol biopolymer transport system component/C-terminal processing protease CtpA/Prc
MPPTLLRAIPATLLAAALTGAAPDAAQDATPRPMFVEPGISPDGREIAFASGGDLWVVDAAGGTARLLVAHPATESRPLFSPDGTRLAFVSNRTGNGDLYVLTLASGDLLRVTYGDQLDQLDAWSADGRWLYFTTSAYEVAGVNDVYRVSADGGTPMPVSADRYRNEYWSQPSPGGVEVALTARGTVSGQWWRRGHSHLDESEIWVLRDPTAMRYERLSEGGQKDAWPLWSADARMLWFVRDRQGVQNVWVRSAAGGEARQATRFTDGRVLWPSITRDGALIAFERGFRLWVLETGTFAVRELAVTLRGAPVAVEPERLSLTTGFSDLALSPDGRKVAFVARGEVFAASAKDGGDAFRVTATPGREAQLTWAPDSRRLVYVSDRAGHAQLWLYDFAARTETRLTDDPSGDVNPRFSPDGRQVLFARGGRTLALVDAAGGAVRTLATNVLDRQPFTSPRAAAFSPDGRWVAFLGVQGRNFNTVFAVPTAGGEARPVSFLADVFGSTLAWSPDGNAIYFDTRQRTETGQLARVDLVPRTPRFREDQFHDLFTAPAPTRADSAPRQAAAPRSGRGAARASTDTARARSVTDTATRRPAAIIFEGIRGRLSFLPLGVDPTWLEIAPDGKSLVVTAQAEGQQNLYLWSLDELAREAPVARQLTSTAGGKGSVQFSPDGKEVWYLEGGRIRAVTVESRAVRTLDVTAELDVDFAQEKLVVFDEGWRYLRDGFYDSTMHGTDWRAVRAAYAPFAAGARTGDELRRMMALMVGELNASHLGVSGPPSPGAGSGGATGRLGIDWDRGTYEADGRFRVATVLPLGPAAIAGVAAGEFLLAVNGVPVGARTSIERLLAGTVGRRVELTLSRGADGAAPRTAALQPIGTFAEKQLRYRQWVEERRAYVARASDGRLGYVHMPDMGGASLAQLYVDLDAETMDREGVVIDLRHNNGGFVNAYALDVFARRGYLTMTGRGTARGAPARTILGQRSLERPTVLVVDQHSLSDAEDFTEGYRALQLGPIVGEPTAGWIIYTSNVPLVDGTVVRIPFTEVRGADGTVMELRPRPVDVRVDRPVGESYTGRDSQLDTAVTQLLGRLRR